MLNRARTHAWLYFTAFCFGKNNHTMGSVARERRGRQMVCRQQDTAAVPAKGWRPPSLAFCWKVNTLRTLATFAALCLVWCCRSKQCCDWRHRDWRCLIVFLSFFESGTKRLWPFAVNRINGYRTESVFMRKNVNPPVLRWLSCLARVEMPELPGEGQELHGLSVPKELKMLRWWK